MKFSLELFPKGGDKKDIENVCCNTLLLSLAVNSVYALLYIKQDQKSTRCNISEPDSAKPESAKPDSAKPATTKPDIAKVDIAKPDIAKPKA